MTTYRLLFIDANEHIDRSTLIECPTDQRAVDIAAQEPGDYKARHRQVEQPCGLAEPGWSDICPGGTVNLSSMERREARWVELQPSTDVITQPSPHR
jgi:hypothetical protein